MIALTKKIIKIGDDDIDPPESAVPTTAVPFFAGGLDFHIG